MATLNPAHVYPGGGQHVGSTSPTPKPDTVGVILNNTAKRYNIPEWVLWGVFGLESGWGKADNWFGLVSIPRSTYGVDAQGRHYDSGGKTTFSGDADIAAATLSQLYKSFGNWDAALSTYNVGEPTGGYTSAKIMSVWRSRPNNLFNYYPKNLGEKLATGPIGDAAKGISDALSVPAKFFALITSLEFWLRIGEGIAGLILIALGLKALTGANIPNVVPVPV